MNKRHRIFIAINLPGDMQKFLARKEKELQSVPAKWVPEENFHITLVFLGDLTDIELGEACLAVKSAAAAHEPFEIRLEKIHYGPARNASHSDAGGPEEKYSFDSFGTAQDRSAQDKLPKFIWASGEKSNELSQLKDDVQDALLEKINFLPEKRGFTPHVTLGRVKTMEWRQIEPEERQEVDEAVELVFSVESIEVMESHRAKSGPEYTVIESFPLAES